MNDFPIPRGWFRQTCRRCNQVNGSLRRIDGGYIYGRRFTTCSACRQQRTAARQAAKRAANRALALMDLRCQQCKTRLQAVRVSKRYCSNACRQAAYRAR